MKSAANRIAPSYFAFYMMIALAACSGGGGSSPPSPSLSSNLPSTAFDDETIVVTVTARNFGSGNTTYNATSNSLFIEQGDSDNQFVITGINSVPGNHTISFSASDTSGNSATLNSSIRIDAVATGTWYTTSLSIDGIYADDISAAIVVTREGRVYVESYTYDSLDEKCFGSSSTAVRTLTFEVWCANAPDGYFVTDENYRLTGEIDLGGSVASGEYSLYSSSGGLVGTVDVEMERPDFYAFYGVSAPDSAEGLYANAYESGFGELITIDSSGNLSPVEVGGNCDVDGTVAPVDIDVLVDSGYVNRGVFDARSLSQRGCIEYGDLSTGNRDIIGGEGILKFLPGALYGFPPNDEVLWLFMSDSVSSYGGIPSSIPYLRVCTASGDPTPFSDAFGFSGACSGQSSAAKGNSFSWHELTKPPKTLPYTSLHALPRPYRQAQ